MSDKIQMEVTKEEYEILMFYRNLPKERKNVFMSFMKSLQNMIKAR